MIPAVMISGRTPARGAVKPVLLKGLSAIQMHLAKLQARGANLAYVYLFYLNKINRSNYITRYNTIRFDSSDNYEHNRLL